MGRLLGARMDRPDGALLLGRWSYEQLLSHWNVTGGAFKDALNNAPKYHGLIDEYLLLTYPLVLGSGQRMFDGDGRASSCVSSRAA